MRVVRIPKNQLMLIAGMVWCASGAMVAMIGLPLEFRLAPGDDLGSVGRRDAQHPRRLAAGRKRLQGQFEVRAPTRERR